MLCYRRVLFRFILTGVCGLAGFFDTGYRSLLLQCTSTFLYVVCGLRWFIAGLQEYSTSAKCALLRFSKIFWQSLGAYLSGCLMEIDSENIQFDNKN